MLSRLLRGKSEPKPTGKPLRGMPALKQMRSSQRQEALWPKLAASVSPNNTNGDAQAKELQYTPKQSHDDLHVQLRSNNGLTKKDKRLSYQEPPVANGRMLTNRPSQRVGNGISELDRNRNASQKSKTSEPSSPSSPTSPTSPSTRQNSRGRHLHSVKKKRKESRESTVSTSMRALTPLERESILCLEQVIQQHLEFNFEEGPGDEENVFESPIYEEEDDYESVGTSDSDNTSVGSIIDLVGNLSPCSSPRSSDRYSPTPNSNNSSNKNSTSSSYRYDAAQSGRQEDVYARVDRQYVERKRAEKSAKKQASTIADDATLALSSLQISPQTKASRRNEVYPGTNLSASAYQEAPYSEEEPTAKSSRLFWQKISEKNTTGLLGEIDHCLVGSNKALPGRKASPNSVERSDSFDMVPGATRNQFTVVPNKLRTSSSSLSSRGSYVSDAAADDARLSPPYRATQLDAPRNRSPTAVRGVKSPKVEHSPHDTDSDADSGCQADPYLAAAHRLSDSQARHKPFVITPATKRELSYT